MKVNICIDINSTEEVESARAVINELQNLVQSIQQLQPSSTTLPLSGVGDIVVSDVNIPEQQQQQMHEQQVQDQLSESKETLNPKESQQVVQNQENKQQSSQSQEQEQQMNNDVVANGGNQIHPPHHSPPPSVQNVQNVQQEDPMAAVIDQVRQVLESDELRELQAAQGIMWIQQNINATGKQIADIYFGVVIQLVKDLDPENYQKYIKIFNYFPNELQECLKRVFVENIVRYLLRSIDKLDKDIVFHFAHVLAFMHQEKFLKSDQAVGVALRLLKQDSFLQGIMLLCKLSELSANRLKEEAAERLKEIRQILVEKNDLQNPGQDLSYEVNYFKGAMGWNT